MAWTTAVADIRMLLSDGPTDKLCWRKKVIGHVDGANRFFKTFEKRRITSFVSAGGNPEGVFINGAFVNAQSEDLESGQFTLQTAPNEGDSVVATYYSQWFNDDEIQEFLTSAAEWIGGFDDYTQISPALLPAAKEYAASQAYQKLVARMSANLAETYQLYDAPDQKRFDPIKVYMDISDAKLKNAFELRDDVYKDRKGQALAPLFATNRGRVRDVPPKR